MIDDGRVRGAESQTDRSTMRIDRYRHLVDMWVHDGMSNINADRRGNLAPKADPEDAFSLQSSTLKEGLSTRDR